MTMGDSVELTYPRLIEVFAVLIAHARDISASESFSVPNDLFWSIPVEDMTIPVAGAGDVYEHQPELTIGQVAETWNNIESMIDDESIISYGLIWFADILRAIGNASTG
ncbi:hypothetical protein AB0H42_35490 [Nocardia sp. NPDC050799]|uniref:hypothetical protein n=1 Tax=Nocardia sp. NPDC050799 TaxID=3154842 RepID=UPI0033DDD6A0